MKYIAHRGLINGPDSSLENSPEQIIKSLKAGFDCEIDLRLVDGRLMLGHDFPQYEITADFLYQPGLWIHCKNFDALVWCSNQDRDINYFWHDTDAYTLTSHQWIWAYPGQPVNEDTIQVMPEMADPTLNNIDWSAAGVCSDWILRIQAQRP